MLRAVVRVTLLAAADLAALGALHLVRYITPPELLPGMLGQFVEVFLPKGYLGGMQFMAAMLLGLAATGAYGAGDRRRDPARLLIAVCLGLGLQLWATLWVGSLAVTLVRFTFTLCVLSALVCIGRLVVDRAARRLAPHPHSSPRTLLVGESAECVEMLGRSAFSGASGFQVVGVIQTDGDIGAGSETIDNIERMLHEHRADTVLLCGQVHDELFVKILKLAMVVECQVLTGNRRLDMAGVQPSVLWRQSQPLLEWRAPALRWPQLFTKRLVDIIAATSLLVLAAPLMVAVAIAIRLESTGPIFFGQLRLGRFGGTFRCYKFRSMYMDAEARLRADPDLHAEYVRNDYKLPEGRDTRITSVGRFLRKASLDELPQLWNVLTGDMSLVGPRPIVPAEIAHYRQEELLLLSLRPGVTGAWQVSGRSRLGYPERALVELEYVQRWSLMRDIGILVRTVPAVLAQRGAH